MEKRENEQLFFTQEVQKTGFENHEKSYPEQEAKEENELGQIER